MKTELKMTVDELEFVQFKSNDAITIDGIEYDDCNYRARVSQVVNPIRFYDTKDSDGKSLRIVAIWGYQMDEDNRINRRGYTMWNDELDDGEWIDRVSGDVAMQWFVPSNVDFGSAVIDWHHPDVIID